VLNKRTGLFYQLSDFFVLIVIVVSAEVRLAGCGLGWEVVCGIVPGKKFLKF